MNKLILPALILFLCASCRKENPFERKSEINVGEFKTCHHSQHLDSIAIVNKLSGTWEWLEESCMNSHDYSSNTKIVKATLNSSGTFTITQNSAILFQGNWSIEKIGANGFGADSLAFQIRTNIICRYLNGIIYLCENKVLFAYTYTDGCNSLFVKD